MESLTNVTFDEICVGDTANVSRKLSAFEVEALALGDETCRPRLTPANGGS